MDRIALITGANRGLGWETARELARLGYRVVLTARDQAKAEEAVARLAKEGLKAEPHTLDVSQEKSIGTLCDTVLRDFRHVDVLVNNAGILLGSKGGEKDALDTDVELVRRTIETNTFGPYQMCQRLIPAMMKHGYGRVVNVSSGMGQLSDMESGHPAYRISKTALNAVTRVFAAESRGHNVLVNSVCPGWVRTDMGGPQAHRTIPQGADTIVWLATLPDDGPTGGFFRDRKPIAW